MTFWNVWICFKYLGIHLDQSLDWNDHIHFTSRKINSKLLALLRRLRPFLTEQSSRMLANSLVQPHFDYCSSAWSNCNANLRDSVVKLQKKMGRIILQADPRTPTDVVLSKLRCVSIENRWKFQNIKLVHNAINGNLPIYQQDLFSRTASRHTYSTRNAESNGLCVPKVRTEKGKRSISYKGSLLWNGLPERLRNEPTLTSVSSRFWRLWSHWFILHYGLFVAFSLCFVPGGREWCWCFCGGCSLCVFVYLLFCVLLFYRAPRENSVFTLMGLPCINNT